MVNGLRAARTPISKKRGSPRHAGTQTTSNTLEGSRRYALRSKVGARPYPPIQQRATESLVNFCTGHEENSKQICSRLASPSSFPSKGKRKRAGEPLNFARFVASLCTGAKRQRSRRPSREIKVDELGSCDTDEDRNAC